MQSPATPPDSTTPLCTSDAPAHTVHVRSASSLALSSHSSIPPQPFLAEELEHAGAFITKPSAALRQACQGLDDDILNADVFQYCGELKQRGVGEGSEFVAEAMMASFGSMRDGFLDRPAFETSDIACKPDVEDAANGGMQCLEESLDTVGNDPVQERHGGDLDGPQLIRRLSREALLHAQVETSHDIATSNGQGPQEKLLQRLSTLSESLSEAGGEADNRMRTALEILLFGGENVGGEQGRLAMEALESGLGISSADEEREATIENVLKEIYRAVADFGAIDGKVVERAAVVMGKLAIDVADVGRVIANTGGVTVLLEAVKKHDDNVVVHDVTIYALLAITQQEEGRTKIAEGRGVEFVTLAMNQFQRITSIVTNGALTLCNLAYGHDENKKRIGKVGGIDAISNAMLYHGDNAELQARCCLALRNLTYGSKANQWIAGRACAMENIVLCIKSFPNDKDVQYHSVVALGNIVAEAAQNRERASNIDLVPTVLEAIKAGIDNASLVEHGMTVLRNLSIACEENQLLIGDSGGVQLVLNCLKQYRSHEGIITKGCAALRYLFFSKRNRETMFNSGHLELLVRILRDNAEVAEVAEKVVLAVGNASFDIHESKRALGRFGGVSAVVDVMAHHMDAENLQAYGCRTLRNLADCDELNVRLLGESGAIDIVICTIRIYPDNEDIQEQAFAMLFNMAFSENNLKQMRDLEVMQIAQDALSYYESNARIQIQASALIRRLQPLGAGESQAALPGKTVSDLSKKKSASPFERKKTQGVNSGVGRGRKVNGKALSGK